jgi:hypothetical protein
MLRCSSFVMGLNNHVHIFCYFCWVPVKAPITIHSTFPLLYRYSKLL